MGVSGGSWLGALCTPLQEDAALWLSLEPQPGLQDVPAEDNLVSVFGTLWEAKCHASVILDVKSILQSHARDLENPSLGNS